MSDLLTPAQAVPGLEGREGHLLFVPHAPIPGSAVTARAEHPALVTCGGRGPRGSSGWSEGSLRNGWHLLATVVTTDSVQAKDKAPVCGCFSWAPNPFLGTVESGSRLSRSDRRSHSCWAPWALAAALQESGCSPDPGAAASSPCSAECLGRSWSARWTCPSPEGR